MRKRLNITYCPGVRGGREAHALILFVECGALNRLCFYSPEHPHLPLGVLTFVGIFTTYVNDKGTSIDVGWTAL
jgi:hypothetical protein